MDDQEFSAFVDYLAEAKRLDLSHAFTVYTSSDIQIEMTLRDVLERAKITENVNGFRKTFRLLITLPRNEVMGVLEALAEDYAEMF